MVESILENSQHRASIYPQSVLLQNLNDWTRMKSLLRLLRRQLPGWQRHHFLWRHHFIFRQRVQHPQLLFRQNQHDDHLLKLRWDQQGRQGVRWNRRIFLMTTHFKIRTLLIQNMMIPEQPPVTNLIMIITIAMKEIIRRQLNLL